MKVEMFAVRFGGGKSFQARVDEGQTITIVEAFEVLKSGELPVAVGMCSLAARMQFDQTEAGIRQIGISFVDNDSQQASPNFKTTIEVKIPDDAPAATVPFAFLIKLLCLPAFGEYSVELAVDGRVEASIPLYVRSKIDNG